MWIECDADSLVNGECTMNVNDTVWIHPKNNDLKSFTSDTFAGFTMFIGFVVFVALVYSWVLMVFWGADEKQFEKWKKWVIYSVIWLFLVGFAYGIIRFIQLVAKG